MDNSILKLNHVTIYERMQIAMAPGEPILILKPDHTENLCRPIYLLNETSYHTYTLIQNYFKLMIKGVLYLGQCGWYLAHASPINVL
jgi:hypothetical protein